MLQYKNAETPINTTFHRFSCNIVTDVTNVTASTNGRQQGKTPAARSFAAIANFVSLRQVISRIFKKHLHSPNKKKSAKKTAKKKSNKFVQKEKHCQHHNNKGCR